MRVYEGNLPAIPFWRKIISRYTNDTADRGTPHRERQSVGVSFTSRTTHEYDGIDRVLFVCTGNIFRSLTAEYALRAALLRIGRTDSRRIGRHRGFSARRQADRDAAICWRRASTCARTDAAR